MSRPKHAISLVCLDADDTLWHHEQYYQLTQARFMEFLNGHADGDHVAEKLLAAEKRNLEVYGYGVKGFTLSMVETALEVTNNELPSEIIKRILDAGRELLAHPMETLPGVEETLEKLCDEHKLVLITKGDLFDQERKLAASGLGEMFSAVEIVSEKTAHIYGQIFDTEGRDRGSCVMVGNSVKSDVLPPIAAGGWGIHVPHEHNWAHEHAEPPIGARRYRTAKSISEIPAILDALDMGES